MQEVIFVMKRDDTLILSFSLNSWDGPWMSRQQILSRLAQKGWTIVYSRGLFFTWDIKSSAWKKSKNFINIKLMNDVYVLCKSRINLRNPKYSWFDACSLFVFSLYIKYLAWKKNKKNIVLHIFHPSFFSYIKFFKNSKIIYHIYDAYHLCPGWNSELNHYEMKLISQADKIISLSIKMIPILNNEVQEKLSIISNGVDYELFSAGLFNDCPEELSVIKSPRIGYVGSINSKLDLQLVAEICEQKPEWNWIFLGRITEPIERSVDPYYIDGLAKCRQCRNVHFLGERHHEMLPAYMAHMDVNAMCYRTTEDGWWAAISPLKLHEYLAVGKPVISSSIDAVMKYNDVIDICQSRNDWITAIDNGIKGGVGSKKMRQIRASLNSWDDRVSKIEKIYEEL